MIDPVAGGRFTAHPRGGSTERRTFSLPGSLVHVRVNYGPDAGRVLEFPFHVGDALVKAGRGERVDPLAPVESAPVATPETVRTAEPLRTHRDPAIAPQGASGGLTGSARATRRARR